jgi:hypothetical protein
VAAETKLNFTQANVIRVTLSGRPKPDKRCFRRAFIQRAGTTHDCGDKPQQGGGALRNVYASGDGVGLPQPHRQAAIGARVDD